MGGKSNSLRPCMLFHDLLFKFSIYVKRCSYFVLKYVNFTPSFHCTQRAFRSRLSSRQRGEISYLWHWHRRWAFTTHSYALYKPFLWQRWILYEYFYPSNPSACTSCTKLNWRMSASRTGSRHSPRTKSKKKKKAKGCYLYFNCSIKE